MDNYIVLPLYSKKGEEKVCFPKSSMNQSNASGRERDPYEVYIPIPSKVREVVLNFFPNGNFDLYVPSDHKTRFDVKVCQENDKALMSNPNSDLGKWLFSELGIIKNTPNDVISYSQLKETGKDSVKIEKINEKYYISLMPVNSYENFSQ